MGMSTETKNTLLNFEISAFTFSARTCNCMKAADIRTLGELCDYSEDDLMGIPNFGKKTLSEIKNFLRQFGLSLSNS